MLFQRVVAGVHMKNMKSLKTIAAGGLLAGALGMAALGVGSGVANADPGWGHGHGHDWGRGGPGWGAPPPPYYGYGGYGGGGYDQPCLTGPLGLLHLCA